MSLRYDRECDFLIDDSFLNDHLLALVISSVSWYVNLVNYLACEIVLIDVNSNQKKWFFF